FRVCEVTIGVSTVSDCPRDAIKSLPHRSFSSALVWVGAVGNVAVEILRHGDFRGERAPILRDLDVFLLENDLAAVVSDFRSAAFPFDLIKWRDGRIAEQTLERHAATFLSFHP